MLTDYHEGGHAVVALNVIATDPVHKATIIPRGRALGMVMQLPERDKLSMSMEQMTSRSCIDRKSTRLNSSHTVISYAVFCLKKKKKTDRSHVESDKYRQLDDVDL